MKRMSLIMAIMAIGLVGQAFATVRYVSQTSASAFTTVAAALTASGVGDTIMISPGTYNEGITTFSRRYLMGAGIDLTTITGLVNFTAGTNGSVIEGIRIETTSLGFIGGGASDTVTIRRCMVKSSGNVVAALGNCGRVIAEDCIFQSAFASPSGLDVVSVPTTTTRGVVFRNCIFSINNPSAGNGSALSGANTCVVEVYNCVFLNFNKLFNLTGSQPIIAINNVAYDWALASPSWGAFPASSSIDYMAADASAPAIPGSFTNSISLGANNPFVNYNTTTNYTYGTSDLHLTGAGGALLTNSGNPLIFDIDGSRSDVGVYGGPRPFVDNGAPAFPFTLTLTLPTLIGVGDSVNTSSTGRIGPRY